MKLPRFNQLLAPAFAILGIVSVQAAELRLSNGDVLRGELVSVDDGTIRFASPVLGIIEVPEGSATVVEGASEAAGQDAATPVPAKKRDIKEPGGELESSDSDKEGGGPGWRSKVAVGLNLQQGSKDKHDVSFRFESRRKLGHSDYRILTRYLFSETNGTKSADSRDAGLRWRRDFNERWFSQTNTTYYDDSVREIDLNIDQNVGFGYRLLASDRTKANFGAGVTVQYRHAAGIDEGIAKFGEFFQDLAWRFHERFELTQEATALFSPDERPIGLPTSDTGPVLPSGVSNYRLTFESVLRGYLTETMSVNLSYEYRFDNAISNRDARSDQRITTALGYTF